MFCRIAVRVRCLFCREGFTTDAELTAHVATHNKPFSCPVCGEAFLVEFLLDRHLETHHRCLDVVPAPSSLPCLPLDAAAAVLYSRVCSVFEKMSEKAQKTGRLKMQEWKMREQIAGVENAGVENA